MLVIKVHEWFMNFNTSKIQSIVVIKQVHVPGQLFHYFGAFRYLLEMIVKHKIHGNINDDNMDFEKAHI